VQHGISKPENEIRISKFAKKTFSMVKSENEKIFI
jgi:hypothetical protein